MKKKVQNLLMRTNRPSSLLEGQIFQTDTDSETNQAQNLISPDSGDVLFMSAPNKYPYKLATLNNANGDPTKRWSISFYVWHTGRNALVRKQVWISLKLKTKAQKMAEATKLIRQINDLLVKGYHISPEPKAKRPKYENLSVLEAIRWVEDRKTPSIRKRSKQSFQLFYKEFTVWLEENNLARLPLHLLTSDHLDSYLAWVRKKRKVGNSTYNNYLTFVKITFNHLVRHGKLDFSPASKLQRLVQEEPTNVAFPTEVRAQLLRKYEEVYPELGIFARYIYYTFIRPKELRLLRVSNVLEKTIYIPGSTSKNKKSEHVLISPALERMLVSFGVRSAPSHFYLIGHDGRPSEYPVSTNFYTMRHLDIRRQLELPDIYTLYCWKHTGVTDTYQQTLDIEFVSRQCRHSSLDMTKRYLRGLGLIRDYPLQDRLPDLDL